ncbi:MAG: hypothetical protein H0S79_25910 [Anaerolineaceae bacterium]|nr:hypothetical protein [Anaerolineaceae bacterium]
MKTSKNKNLSIWILFAAFAVGLALRLIRLGVLPLGDQEASLAMQALAVASHETTIFSSFAAYVGLTGFDFYLFTSGNFMARFWFALAGSLVVFVPWLFRERIGQWPAVLLAGVLAISPEMVGLSRIIGSPMMAFVFFMLAFGLYLKQKPILAGGALALALMSGPSFWLGLVILGVSSLIFNAVSKDEALFDPLEIEDKKEFWLRFGVAFGATLLVVGTGFTLAPANLSGVFAGLVDFIQGFAAQRTTDLFQIPLALVAYTVEALIIGLWGSVRAILVRDRLGIFLLIWWLFGLVFLLLYPAGSAADIIWVTAPLWLLMVRTMFFAWRLPEEYRGISALTAILIVAVFAFMLLVFRGMINPYLAQGLRVNYLLALVGGAVLLVAIVLMVSFGWSQEVAIPGLLVGLTIVFVVGLFALSVQSTGLAPERSWELWYPDEAQVTTVWLRDTIDDIVDSNVSGKGAVEIVVSDFDRPGLRWLLRDDPKVEFVSYPAPQSEPGILITSDQEIPEIAGGYRGQDLVWESRPVWSGMRAFDYVGWLLTRDAPVITENVIIWVRTDLMPDAQFSN